MADLPVGRFHIDRVTYTGELGEVSVAAWLGGRTTLTADEQEGIVREAALVRRSIHVLNVVGQVEAGRVRPGVLYRVPLSETFSEQLRSAAGVSLAVML